MMNTNETIYVDSQKKGDTIFVDTGKEDAQDVATMKSRKKEPSRELTKALESIKNMDFDVSPSRALITGITGQDGSYLAEFLLKGGYEVHGLMRRSSTFSTGRIEHIFDHPDLRLHYGDLSDGSSLARLLAQIKPDEIYNLAAQSHVKVSYDCPEYSTDIGAIGVVRLLEAIREAHIKPKFYQASSSEMFGSTPPPQNEVSHFYPRSPYGCAKVFAFHIVRNYREAYGLKAWNGILFNHESPRRGPTFVTRKITRAVAAIKAGLQNKLVLGNLDAKRDWGYAPDYVEAMWMMLQEDYPDDFVIATGECHTVREFLAEAFGHVGLDWEKYVAIDARYFRPAEVEALQGNANKARATFGWEPKVKFKKLVQIMVDADIELLAKHREGKVKVND